MSRETHQTGMDMLRRFVSSNFFLVVSLVLAAVLRVGHTVALAKLPVFDVLILDSWMYDEWAKRITSGDWLGGPRPFYMDPLYPYFLALVYRLFGRDLLIVRLIQAALGVGTCALVAIMGRRVAGRSVGNTAAFLMAVCRPAIFQEGEIEKTALGVFLLTAGLVFVSDTSRRRAFAAGVAIALAALARGNLLIFGPLGAVYYFYRSRRAAAPAAAGLTERASAGTPNSSFRTRAAAPLLFLSGFLITLAPVTWRNYYVSGERVLTTSGAGANFYTGNNPANRSGAFEPVPFVRPHPAFEEEDFRAAAEQRLGRPLRTGEISAYWYGRAWDHLRNHPGFGLTVMGRKTMLFWSDFELPDGWDMYLLARYSAVLAFVPIGMAWLLPLAFIGAVIEFNRNSAVRLLVGFITFYAAAVILFFIFSRYRVYVFPALAVLAAVGLRWIAHVLEARDLRRGAATVVGMAAVGGLSIFGLNLTGVRMADPAQGFMNLAAVYYEKGDAGASERLLADAVRQFPQSPSALCGMGRLQLAKGYWRVSADFLTRCLTHNPRFPQAWFSLGQAYQAGGLLADAAEAYQKQLELVPGHVQAAQMLAEIEVALARPRR